MKKFTFAAVAAVAAIMMSSCGNGTPKANLKSDIDTMSYAIGMAQTQGLKEYLVGSLDVDTTYMAEFIQIGQQISNRMMKGINYQVFGDDSTKTISMKNFMAGFISGTTGKKALMSVDSAQVLAERLMRNIKAKQMEKTYAANREAGEKFLAENAKKDGVKTLPSGVQYKVIKEGNGPIPTDSSTVKVNYEGRLIDGTVFDSSYTRGEAATFPANRVIKGWTEALCHMPAGSEWEIYIPQELAYGEREQGKDIKPFSALIFKLELLEVDPKK